MDTLRVELNKPLTIQAASFRRFYAPGTEFVFTGDPTLSENRKVPFITVMGNARDEPDGYIPPFSLQSRGARGVRFERLDFADVGSTMVMGSTGGPAIEVLSARQVDFQKLSCLECLPKEAGDPSILIGSYDNDRGDSTNNSSFHTIEVGNCGHKTALRIKGGGKDNGLGVAKHLKFGMVWLQSAWKRQEMFPAIDRTWIDIYDCMQTFFEYVTIVADPLKFHTVCRMERCRRVELPNVSWRQNQPKIWTNDVRDNVSDCIIKVFENERAP